MRPLFDHDGDRGEAADRAAASVVSLLLALALFFFLAWLLGFFPDVPRR